MTSQTLVILCEISVIAYALVSGVFLTFSDFVMKSLGATQPAGGIEAMQIINRKVFRTVFMVLLIGMAILSPVWMGYAFHFLSGTPQVLILVGGSLYTVGVLFASLIGNIPMNERLDKLDHTAKETAEYWDFYVRRWSQWNTARTISSALSAICFLQAAITLAKMSVS
ncbi:MAG: anthrone oxygenase family protein [Sneathiella sp.]